MSEIITLQDLEPLIQKEYERIKEKIGQEWAEEFLETAIFLHGDKWETDQ